VSSENSGEEDPKKKSLDFDEIGGGERTKVCVSLARKISRTRNEMGKKSVGVTQKREKKGGGTAGKMAPTKPMKIVAQEYNVVRKGKERLHSHVGGGGNVCGAKGN